MKLLNSIAGPRRPCMLFACAAGWIATLAASAGTAEEAPATRDVPPVAVHVSETTAAQWANLGGPHAEWKYWHVWGFLLESLHSDGTPAVTLSDQQINDGGLLVNGQPRYPIVISLASACIADRTAEEFARYVRAGGHVWVGSTAWTRDEHAAPRMRDGQACFALGELLGLAPRGTSVIGVARKVADDPLVAQLSTTDEVNWLLPRSAASIGYSHPVHWIQNTAVGAARVLLQSGEQPLLAVAEAGRGRLIYQAEFCPLAGYSGYVVDNLEYSFFRNAIDAAYRAAEVPLVRLAPWPYPSVAAFKTRHDHFLHYKAALLEAQHEVRGEWLLRTDPAIGGGDWKFLEEIRKSGALIGSHTRNEYTLDSGNYQIAHDNVSQSLDALKAALGERPTLFVAPGMMAVRDSSLQALVDNGLVTTGDVSHGPFPSYALKIDTAETYGPEAHWPILEIPVSRLPARPGQAWSNLIYSHMEDMPLEVIRDTVDLSYALGGVINLYDHVGDPAAGIRARWPHPTTEHFEFYLKYGTQKPGVWKTDPLAILAWWKQREASAVLSAHWSGDANSAKLAIVVRAAEGDLPVAVDVRLPASRSAGAVTSDDGGPVEHVALESMLKIKVPRSGKIFVELKGK